MTFMAHEISPRFNIAEWFLDRPGGGGPGKKGLFWGRRGGCYGELRELANRVGNGLAAGGCARGDRVLIVLRDSAEFIAAFFGAAKIGAIPVPVNSFARAGDYSFYISDSGASIASVDESALDEFSSAVAAAASEVRVIV